MYQVKSYSVENKSDSSSQSKPEKKMKWARDEAWFS